MWILLVLDFLANDVGCFTILTVLLIVKGFFKFLYWTGLFYYKTLLRSESLWEIKQAWYHLSLERRSFSVKINNSFLSEIYTCIPWTFYIFSYSFIHYYLNSMSFTCKTRIPEMIEVILLLFMIFLVLNPNSTDLAISNYFPLLPLI